MSREKVGISKASSEPPCTSAPNSSAASTMPAGWLRPISATAMPVKPAPATKSSSSRWCTPSTSLMPTPPASAPEPISAISVSRTDDSPA